MKHTKMVVILLALVLIPTIVIASTTVMIDHSKFVRVYLSSEISVDGRAEFDAPQIVGKLQSRVRQGNSTLSYKVESIILLPYGRSYGSGRGYFEGQSYNRYLDISTLWLLMEWETVSENFTTQYYMDVNVNTTDGKITWDFYNDTWTFGWMWGNYRTYSRPQDDYLYGIRMCGYLLLGFISGCLLYQVLEQVVRRMKKREPPQPAGA